MKSKQPIKKTRKTTPQRKRNRLTNADTQALNLLDRLVEEDRRIEQKYNLPFRSPRQVATSLRQCVHCGKDIALLIFGDLAKDVAGLGLVKKSLPVPDPSEEGPGYGVEECNSTGDRP